MICKNCGNKIPEGTEVCPNCGYDQKVEKEKKCKKYGKLSIVFGILGVTFSILIMAVMVMAGEEGTAWSALGIASIFLIPGIIFGSLGLKKYKEANLENEKIKKTCMIGIVVCCAIFIALFTWGAIGAIAEETENSASNGSSHFNLNFHMNF